MTAAACVAGVEQLRRWSDERQRGGAGGGGVGAAGRASGCGGEHERRERGVDDAARFDATPPSGEFDAVDPRDPTRIRLRASDAVSGVARVELEVRREGETAWHSLVAEGGDGRYSAVLDDAVYPKGSYEVRARVIDQAENERTIVKTAGGQRAARGVAGPGGDAADGREGRRARRRSRC